jgi:hypothetical protein
MESSQRICYYCHTEVEADDPEAQRVRITVGVSGDLRGKPEIDKEWVWAHWPCHGSPYFDVTHTVPYYVRHNLPFVIKGQERPSPYKGPREPTPPEVPDDPYL